MKIYPCTHNVYSVEKVNIEEEIVLGYLDSDFVEESLKVTINNGLNKTIKKELLPYQTIDTLEKSFYDNNGNAISKDTIEQLFFRLGDGSYEYRPISTIDFEPLKFSYSVLVKRKMKYLSSRDYKVKAACSDIDLAKKLINYFSDSNERKICPSNIKFNNGSKALSSLINLTKGETDFLFIESEDGEHLNNGTSIDIEDCLSNKIIPFIFCDKLPDQRKLDYKTTIETNFYLNENTFSKRIPCTTKYFFNIPASSIDEFYINVFDDNLKAPMIIKEYKNKGHVVYCHRDFLNRLNEFYTIFYEVLMYMYFNKYDSTSTVEEWITDIMPDYLIQNGRLTKKEKFTSYIELSKMLNLQEGDVDIIDVEIKTKYDKALVFFSGMSNDYLVFKKIASDGYLDPIKKSEQISIFTSRKNILFCDRFLYSMAEDITSKIKCKLSNDSLIVTVAPFKNTELDTGNFIYPVELKININTDITKQYIYVYWDNNLKTISLNKEMVKNMHLLATIEVLREKKETKLYDMRIRGGGLPEDEDDIYDCFDIGNIYGKSYRKGGALITTVTLPYKYKDNEENLYNIIEETLKKHMVADEFLVLKLNFE